MVFWVLITPLFLLVCFIVFTFVSHFFLRVPYVPTPRKVVRDMMTIADLRGDEVVLDLGAGDGRVLRSIKKAHPHVRAIGYELSPTIWLLGKLRLLFSRQKVEWRMQNMFKADVCQANAIFLYLFPELMRDLEKKFDQELSSGTKVISYAFSFPHHTPLKQMTVPWLSGNRQLYLYEW